MQEPLFHHHSGFVLRAGILIMLAAAILCGNATQLQAQTTLDRGLQTANNFFTAGNYAYAINEWEQYLLRNPNTPETDKETIWYKIANAGLKLGGNDGNTKAAEYFKKIIDHKDSNGNAIKGTYYDAALFQAGMLLCNTSLSYMQSGNIIKSKQCDGEAKTMFSQLVTSNPKSPNAPEAYFQLIRIVAVNDYDAVNALNYGNQAIANIPNTADNKKFLDGINFYRGWALGRTGNTDEAIRVLGGLVSTGDPEKIGPASLYELANIYFQQGKYDVALLTMSNYETRFSVDAAKFPNDASSSKLNIMRLRASCYFDKPDFPSAKQQIEEIIASRDASGQPVATTVDYIMQARCYIGLQQLDQAATLIGQLESQFGTTEFRDPILLLKAVYFEKVRRPQDAIAILVPLFDAQIDPSGNMPVVLNKKPCTAQVDAIYKTGLLEEYYLKGCGLLAICYAQSGNRKVAEQVYLAMEKSTTEFYGLFSNIRIKTRTALNAIYASTGTSPGISTGTGVPPNSVTTLPAPLPGGPGSGNLSNWTSLPGSIINTQPGTPPQTTLPPSQSTDNPFLLEREQTSRIQQCTALVNRKKYDEALDELESLVARYQLSPINTAKAAVLAGRAYLGKNQPDAARDRFEVAYKKISDYAPEEKSNDTFFEAAMQLGIDADENGLYGEAADYFRDAAATTSGKSGDYQAEVLYRWGCALASDERMPEACACFRKIYADEPESDYWSHAGWQLAWYQYKNRDYVKAEDIIDDLIAETPDQAIVDRVLYLKGLLAQQNKVWPIAVTAFSAICNDMRNSQLSGAAQKSLASSQSKIVK